MKINMNQQPRICPICGQIYHEPPALSRADGKTQICPTVARGRHCKAWEWIPMSRKESSKPSINTRRILE